MRDLINLLAAHARLCVLKGRQLDAELLEIRRMQKDRETTQCRLEAQYRAARAMLCSIRDDLPPGEGRAALGQLIERLERDEEPADESEPHWNPEDVVGLPEKDEDDLDPPDVTVSAR